MEKVLLQFREKQFKDAQKQFEKKTEAGSVLIKEFYNVLSKRPEYSNNIDEGAILNNAIKYLWQVLEQGDNPYKIDGDKIADLFKMNTDKLQALQREYEKLPALGEPQEEDYKDYAETEEELKRLELAKDIASVINRSLEYTQNNSISYKEFYPILTYDNSTLHRVTVNVDWVKHKSDFYKKPANTSKREFVTI